MIVEEIMKENIFTLKADNTIDEALRLMNEKKIRHIPIVNDEDQLIGLVNDRHIKEVTTSINQCDERLEVIRQPLQSVMRTDVVTGHPLDFVEEIAGTFYDYKISCLPIIREQKLVGIVTQTDLLRTLVELTGAHQPGSHIEIRIRNKDGILYRVFSCLQRCKVRILSVLVYPDNKDEDYKILVLRIQTMNPLRLIEELEKDGHQVLWPNLPGMEV